MSGTQKAKDIISEMDINLHFKSLQRLLKKLMVMSGKRTSVKGKSREEVKWR
jgi:hypothetical protein